MYKYFVFRFFSVGMTRIEETNAFKFDGKLLLFSGTETIMLDGKSIFQKNFIRTWEVVEFTE